MPEIKSEHSNGEEQGRQPTKETGKIKRSEDPVGAYLKIVASDLAGVKNSPVLDTSYLTAEQKAESMWALYTEALRLRPRKGKKAKEEMLESKEASGSAKKLQLILVALKDLYGDDDVREIYLTQSAREEKEKTDINGRLEQYRDLTSKISTIEAEVDSCAKQIFGSRGKGASEIDVLLYESSRRQLDDYKARRKEILKDSGDLAALAEYQSLRTYADQLRKENFIWSDSRRQLLEQLEAAAFGGQPVLLSGESGTGKTRLAEQAALKLTGQVCNITPGKDTRFQDLIAKPKISPTGETYFEYKEVGEAFTGRDSTLQGNPGHEGRIVADDEFNLLESSEQTGRLARVASWQPGKKVRMPVTNQEVTIAPHSGYWAMVNLASERYERKKIPPEVLRKFAKVDVGYPPQTATNPELYEMMLAALMDGNGRLRAAESEVTPDYEYEEKEERIGSEQKTKATVRTRKLIENKTGKSGGAVEAGGFLWRFTNAMGELNKSFAHQETVLKARGEAQFVRDLIIDVGKIFSFLKQYAKMGQGKSLEAFVVAKLKEQFLNQEAYTKEDRNLVKDFLRHFGIDIDTTPATESEFKNLSPVEVGLLSPRVEYRKVIKREIDVNEGSYIEPDGTRVEFVQEPFHLRGKEIVPGTVLKNSDGNRIKYIGVRKDNGQPIFGPVEEKGKVKKPESRRELSEFADSIAALQNGLNQRAAEFGVKPPKLELPSLSSDLTKEHMIVFERFLGQNLETAVMPEVKDWDEYFRMMYPETQRPSDTQKDLTSYRPSWWNQKADKNVVGGEENWGKYYERSIVAEARQLSGDVFLTESIQKPNYIDGSQQYGTKEGNDDTVDLLLPIIQEVLDTDKNRFSINWDQVGQVASKVKEKIIAELRAQKLAIPDFDVIITPAIISNMEMTIRHQENSSTSTYEWSSTPLLKKDNTDSGCRLMVGYSGNGGAGYVNLGQRGGSWGDWGFRLSVVLKKP